jgi:class 3 adenylate cyclase
VPYPSDRGRVRLWEVSGTVSYVRSGDVDVAWTITGDGPVDIVYVPGFISHLDLARELSAYGALIGRLERFGRVLTFDKRGTGLSDRELGFGSLAERADDIRAVMDAAGWERAHLFGISEGGPLSLLFAAAFPERVMSLVVYGSFACLLPQEDPESAGFDVARYLNYVERNWGNGQILAGFVHAPSDPAILDEIGRYERACASPRIASQVLRYNLEIDVRPLLSTISVPTLVVHRSGDPLIPVTRGRDLAARISSATLTEVPGDMHTGWDAREWGPVLDAVEEFLTGELPVDADVHRTLATVLFTDIANSTQTAAATGDHIWRDILDRHDTQTRRQVERFGGHVVKQTGDGVLAVFDSPARAVHCARTTRDTLARENITIRAGLHTGEIEQRDEDVSGIAVHIAARVAALAEPSEILVSRTVRDLVVGSDLRFEDRGTHTLKGVPDSWQVFSTE